MTGVLYFGYGAMVNPISRARRNVETVMEKPAVLDNYRLTFAYGGAGNILKARGWSVHGVLMECKSDKDWQNLKDFDAGYHNILVDVFPYGEDEPVPANIFVMAKDEEENAKLPKEKLPQERYIRVIATGMKHHGVDEEYIDYQILNVPYIPSRKPKDYLSFPIKTSARHRKLKPISYAKYQEKANDSTWFLMGNRVIQIENYDPDCAFVGWAKAQVVGKEDCTWCILQTLYDPDLPVCESKEDIQPLHISWAENQLVEKFEQAELTAHAVHTIQESSQKLWRTLWKETFDCMRCSKKKEVLFTVSDESDELSGRATISNSTIGDKLPHGTRSTD